MCPSQFQSQSSAGNLGNDGGESGKFGDTKCTYIICVIMCVIWRMVPHAGVSVWSMAMMLWQIVEYIII